MMKRKYSINLAMILLILAACVFPALAQTGKIAPGQLKVYEDYLTEQGYSLSCTSGADQFIDGGKTLLVRLNCLNDKSQPVLVELSMQKNSVKISKIHPPQAKQTSRK